ncbi:uncharacterized protein LOC132725233 [Ruditapes philippinarum]|uniref:uncharacterized protein LOC132725233 n=1 Tax=Ruditapes philippinarum TaxID=129788 RepID=UPI00295A8B4A|nr:uncharacterized protein LOC132725233 [Ruditapes philippinarum]
MAEGGEHNNPVPRSDADFEYSCTPCADEGNDETALKYCKECKEYLCAACIKYHLKFSATKKHALHDNEHQHCETDSIDTTSDEDQMFKCLYHLDRDIEMYCGDHDMVYCSLCVAKDHRHCTRILELKEATKRISIENKDIILSKGDSLQGEIQVTREKKKINLITLDKEKNEIVKTIKDTERLMIDTIKELALDAQAKACTTYNGLKEELQTEYSVLLQAFTDTNELRSKVKTKVDLDEKRKFARHILHKHSMAELENKHDSVEKDERKMKWFKNEELIQYLSTADCLVQVVGSKTSFNIKDNPIRKQSQNDINIKRNGDKQTCSITGICQLFDGTIILCDRTNKKLKKLNEDYSITEELELASSPSGICLTGKSEVAVKLKDHTILFVCYDKDTLKKNYFIKIEGGDTVGIAYFCDEIWCYTGNDIKVYNRWGTVIKTFNSESFSGTIFNPVGKELVPVATDGAFMYVSDLGNKVACLDREGNVWSVMESKRSEVVRKAGIVSKDIICIAGYTSGNVMMFDGKGKCLGELVDGLMEPDSLCYDNKKQQLLIGYRDLDILTIIKIDNGF